MIQATPVSPSLKVGDVITMDVIIDRRNWWQRRAPLWLGGKPAPIAKCETYLVTAQATVGQFGLPKAPLIIPMPNVLPPKPKLGGTQ